MKLTVETKNLQEMLAAITKVAPTKSTNPSLSLVRIRATTNSCLTFQATSQDISLEKTINADIEEAGEVAMSAHLLSQVVSAAPSELTSLDLQGSKLIVKSGRYKAPLVTANLESATQGFKFPETYQHTWDTQTLLTILSRVVHAAAKSHYEGSIRAVCLDLPKACAVATNRYVLAKYNMPFEKQKDAGQVLLVAKHVDTLLKLLDSEQLNVSFTRAKIYFSTPKTRVSVSTIEHAYPNYEYTLQNEDGFRTVITCNRDDFLGMINRISLLQDETKQHIHLSIKDGVLTSKIGSEKGSAEEMMEISQEGVDIDKIAYTSHYLIQAASSVQGKTITLSLAHGTRPTILTSDDDPDYLALTVPIKQDKI